MTAAAQRSYSQQPAPVISPVPTTLSLREAITQVSDSSRNLLGLMALANAARRDLESGSPETTLDSVISKAALRSLLSALQFRDVATLRHSRRVALLAVGLAHHLGWEGRYLRILEVSALLHDVGKIGVPDTVLYKPGKLTSEEFELMELHHGIGLNVLQACRVDREVLRIVDESHRAYDSKEASSRLIRDVHIGARILAVADAYESLCTDQVYRVAKPHDEIMNVLMAESGKQFDGNVVSSLARWVQQDGLPFAAQSAELNSPGKRLPSVSLEEAAESMAFCQIFSYLYMIESLYDGFHIVDSERRFVIWNRAIDRLVGRPASEMLGKPWTPDLFAGKAESPGTAKLSQFCSLDNAVDGGKAAISRLPFQTPDGTTIQFEVQTVPLIDAQGHLHGVAEIFRNLSRKPQTLSQAPEIKKLKLQASRDALTSVANRGELENQLRILADHYLAHPDEPYCVIFADADHFKRVNDTYGHQVGDQVLIDLAKHFCDETYSGEIVGRYGGEEFVVLCPATELEQAVRRADRLRTSLQNAHIGGIERLKVTCSFGVSQVEPGDTTEEVLKRADRALYAAKEAGRDRTCAFTSQQLLSKESGEASAQKEKPPFEFSGEFVAVLASDMVVHKLSGFVRDFDAEIGDATRDRVVLRLKGGGIMGYFDSSPNRQGIQIELLMDGGSRPTGQQKLKIKVLMSPYGRFRDLNAFNVRTISLMRTIKQYFAGE